MTIERMIFNRSETFAAKKEKSADIMEQVRRQIIDSRRQKGLGNPHDMEEISDGAWQWIEFYCRPEKAKCRFSAREKQQIYELLEHTMFGYGVLDPLIKNPEITEVMVNGIDDIFVEKGGKLQKAKDSDGNDLAFASSAELSRIIERIVMPINRKVDESNPIADARLPNGFRVNIVMRPLALDGNTITIRKFPESPYDMEKLVELEMLTAEARDFLKELVEARYNIIISGGTGSGKTTFLNALSDYIPKESRIITMEDSAELKLMHIDNLIRLETRTANLEGKGEVTMRQLVKASLRMRPDRIIVGEVRGGETLDMLQAMNTGHDGSLSTGHANSASDMLSRLETMVLMADVDLPLAAIRRQIGSSVDIIVHLSKLGNGQRKVTEIIEINGTSADAEVSYRTNTLFDLDWNDLTLKKRGELHQTLKLTQKQRKTL